jgi:glycosyltransferase involved in cell wall biosynthesis
MIEACKILIIGPVNGVGGVRTHVEQLLKLFKYTKSEVKIIKGDKTYELCRTFLRMKPHLVIHNLSVYPKQLLRIMVNRLIMIEPSSKHILHLHGGRFDELGLLENQIIMKIIAIIFRLYDRIFCLTDEQFTTMVKLTKNRAIVRKIYNYVEIPPKTTLVKENGLLNLLYLGRLTAKKGVIDLIQAVQHIEDDKFRLWIIGDGKLKNELYKIKDPRIKFEGKKIGNEKEKYLRKADVFILPSRWPEGMPYAMLEASAYGAALIGTKIGAVDKILFDGINGYFVKPGDVRQLSGIIKKFIQNPDLSKKMGNESYNICEKFFSFDILKNIYRNLFAKWDKEIFR